MFFLQHVSLTFLIFMLHHIEASRFYLWYPYSWSLLSKETLIVPKRQMSHWPTIWEIRIHNRHGSGGLALLGVDYVIEVMCLVMDFGGGGAKHMAHTAPPAVWALHHHSCRLPREFSALLPSGGEFCDSDWGLEGRKISKILQSSWICWEWGGGISAYGGCKKK